jgi:indolepyruvate ferredoxin oxidoreductase beta subunit
MRDRFKLLVVGVGGQGVLLVARCVGEAALQQGQEVMVGQLHGMSQRGGSVHSTVLIGSGHSSFIGPGEADLVLGLEPLEVWRALPMMGPQTVVLMNLGRVVPFTLVQRGLEYPDLDGIRAAIREVAHGLHELDGNALLPAAGDVRNLNILMLGALAGLGLLPLTTEELWQAVEAGERATREQALRGREVSS